MGSITVKKSLLLLFLALALALVVSNVMLARRLSSLQRLDDLLNTSNKLETGSAVPALVGYDVGGNKVSYSYGADRRDTLLLVFSPGCHACDENWPNWTRLIKGLNSHTTRLVIANIAGNLPVTSDYLARHEIEGIPLLDQVSAESLEAYRLGYTPQTILIGGDGTVRKVHTGVLKDGSFALDASCSPTADCPGNGTPVAASLSR